MTIVVFVGDNDSGLALVAKKFDQNAFLIDKSNYKNFLLSEPTNNITVYTSIADLPKNINNSIFFKVLSKADQIIYSPPKVWSDATKEFSWESQQRATEYYLYCIDLEKHNVHGLDLSQYTNTPYLHLKEERLDDRPCLWILGCSISQGVGVDRDQRYGELVAKVINRPVYHLTDRGVSLEWSADQFLRSDVKPNDIVIWGLTAEVRTPKALNGLVTTETDINLRATETQLYKSVTSVYQVVNFCRMVGCQLILLPTICSENLRLMLHALPEYYQLPYQDTFIDVGTDNLHPGVKQHQYWADKLLERLL